ncbi:PucR family transcriptional regulator [Rhodococcus sp. HNM0563]|uniref:PucR family transcriptional regulator n=1 Tax=Rhodococcus sp. HNM0563 TaxID=2716339 RepID=UPI00146D6E1A|nr:helix-turn-helix domain-containing protein [Rhodococcus sp. HNM0563]NLU65624.1 PucR family transcriptional regulator [Rhodococcus sp. HNM0563]
MGPSRARDWMREFVAGTQSPEAIEQIIEDLTSSIGTDVPELARDIDIRRDLHSAVRSQFHLVVAFGQTRETESFPAGEEARSLARTVARRGLELGVLTHLYHAVHNAMRRFVETVAGPRSTLPPEFRAELVVAMWDQTSELMSSLIKELSDTYTAEREEILRGAFSMRMQTIRRILDGGDLGTEDATVRLNFPLHRWSTAFTLWSSDEDHQIDTASLEPLAIRLARSADPIDVLCHPAGTRAVWVWMASRVEAELEIDPLQVPPGFLVALGQPGRGVSGFRQTHQEAQATQHVVMHSQRSHSVTRYREVEIVSMLSQRPQSMTVFVGRELAGILKHDETSGKLRRTLRALLSHAGNVEAAARELGVHKNTVRYRVQQIEQRLGRRLDKHAVSTELALDCVDAFGWPPSTVCADRTTEL